MLPTHQQIQQAAYAQWERGGREQGFALDDWIGAEQDLVLAMNYEQIAHYFLDEQRYQFIGSNANRKCRYCGALPPAPFGDTSHALPAFIGNTSLIANDECDDCNTFFGGTIDDSLGKLLLPLRTMLLIGGRNKVPTHKMNGGSFRLEYDKTSKGLAIKDTLSSPVLQENLENRTISADLTTQPYVPVRLLKCLTKMALAIMPEADLVHCARPLEWIRGANDEQGLEDVREGMTFLSFLPIVFPRPMASLFKRTTLDHPMPAYIFCVGVASLLLQSYLPLCSLDDLWSGRQIASPRLGHVAMSLEGPTQWSVIPVKSATVVKDTTMQVGIKYESRHEVSRSPSL